MREIERKFLVKQVPNQLKGYPKEEILQGYYKNIKEKTIRLRKTIITTGGRKQIKYYLTQKKGKGMIREELEKTISEKEFTKQRHLVENNFLEKTRYKIPYKKYTIELDQYHKKLEGLRTVEVEFGSTEECHSFSPLGWFGEELSEEKTATNRYLASYGMDDLIKKTHTDTTIIKQQLKQFYDNEAKKYAQTRKKHRTDAETIINTIKNINKSDLKILEIGCGSGRLLEHLNIIENKNITYIGVDLSEKLLEWAKKIKTTTSIKTEFICEDMIDFLKTVEQESYDIIIGIASIQHLPSKKERFLAIKYIYRALQYEGIFITTNWSFSKRFIKNHWKSILTSGRNALTSRGKKHRNDLMIPRTSETKTSYRFYHIFTLPELKDLLRRSGFWIKKCCYINKQGQEVQSWKTANNTLLIAEKSAFK